MATGSGLHPLVEQIDTPTNPITVVIACFIGSSTRWALAKAAKRNMDIAANRPISGINVVCYRLLWYEKRRCDALVRRLINSASECLRQDVLAGFLSTYLGVTAPAPICLQDKPSILGQFVEPGEPPLDGWLKSRCTSPQVSRPNVLAASFIAPNRSPSVIEKDRNPGASRVHEG